MLVVQAFGINLFGWVDSLIVQMQKVSRVALVGVMLAQVLNLTFGGLAYVAIAAVIVIVLLIKLLRQRLVPELHKLKQGAAVLRTPRVYIFSVLLLQLIAYFFQNAVVGFFMWGYCIPVSLHAIILNDAANSLATLTAVTPFGSASSASASVVNVWVTPTPPGVTAVNVASELAASLRMIACSETGMP